MLNWLFCKNVKQEPIYIVYQLKDKNIDTIIEESNINYYKKRINQLKKSIFVSKIVFNKDKDIAIQKFYE